MLKNDSEKKREQSVVLPCTCVHEFQDGRYGKGRRLHVKNGKGFDCTVCKPRRLARRMREHAAGHNPKVHGGW